MNRQLLLMRLPEGVTKFDELPQQFEHALGSRATLRAILSAAAPEIRFHDARYATLPGSGFTLEIDLGEREPCTTVLLQIEGSLHAGLLLAQELCSGQPWGVLDLAEVEIIDWTDRDNWPKDDDVPAPSVARRWWQLWK